jgi:hypothetical protein
MLSAIAQHKIQKDKGASLRTALGPRRLFPLTSRVVAVVSRIFTLQPFAGIAI